LAEGFLYFIYDGIRLYTQFNDLFIEFFARLSAYLFFVADYTHVFVLGTPVLQSKDPNPGVRLGSFGGVAGPASLKV